jgi:dTDP-4-amino-4,6-dideoxygalactose transaminase
MDGAVAEGLAARKEDTRVSDPVRPDFLPFHQPWIEGSSIKAVVEVLESGWLTRGPRTEAFERAFAKYVGARHAIGLSSCTAGLHLALVTLGIGPGDEVITSPIAFPASANVIIHQGARPVFADVDPNTLNIDPAQIEARITPSTRAILPVHFAGHPCRMDAILAIARRHGLRVIEDAAHAIESACTAGKVGSIGDFTAFSFYATKNLTTGEGGLLTTDDDALAERARLLSLHGISKDAWKRYAKDGPLLWETLAPGYKYNMFDIQAALGLAQLEFLESWWHVRAAYVSRYRLALADIPEIRSLGEEAGVRHAHHLFVIVLDTDHLRGGRDAVMADLRAEGIGTGIHFRSLSLHPFYRERYQLARGDLPVAEHVSERLLSLPLYPKMTPRDVDDVIEALRRVIAARRR